MTPGGRPSPKALRAVVFDLDDTLYAERDYVHSGYRAIEAHLVRTHPQLSGLAEWMWNRFCQGRSDKMFDAAGEHFGLPMAPEQIAELVDYYRRHRPTIEPNADALAVLEALVIGGRVKLGLLSDGFLPAQQYKLEALGLADRFDAIVFTESLGRQCWKPSTAGFERIAQQLAVPHANCAYIADNPAKDFMAGNQLGWLTVQWLFDGQIHADNPAPPGGDAQIVTDNAAALSAALGVGGD